MWAISNLVNFLNDAWVTQQRAYFYVRDWVAPFNYLATPLYALYTLFYYMAYYMGVFDDWLDYVADKLLDIMSLQDIYDYFYDWVVAAENAWSWVVNSYYSIMEVINDWWDTVYYDVQGWINAAIQNIRGVIDDWYSFINDTFPQWVNTIQQVSDSITNFFTHTLPNLAYWSDVEDWIGSRLNELEPFWSGWQDVRDEVFTFLSDPAEYIWNKFVIWFLGEKEG